MSLATRCNACGTVFRVVEDQLKVSEGWVRCGRCQQVFNAVESLFDLEREAPPPWTPPATAPAGSAPSAAPVPAPVYADDPGLPDDSAPVDLLLDLPAEAPADPSADDLFDALIDSRPPLHETHAGVDIDLDLDVDVDAAPDTVQEPDDEVVDIMLDDEPELQAEPASSAPYLTRETAAVPLASSFAASDFSADAGPPTFMTQAERVERWRRSPLRLGYAFAAGVLALALLLQVALHYRDPLAAAWPDARGALTGLCGLAGCRIEPPRRLESISVDTSGLTRSADGSGYKLTVVLINRAAYEIAMPAIDLSLTDNSGELIARRVLTAADFKSSATGLKPSGLTTLETGLSSSNGKPIAGYTVEVFYP